MDKTKFIPSMFHRRLMLLSIVGAFVLVALTSQMFRLSVVEGANRRAAAEARLDQQTFLPTYRGPILDRYGRILAHDRASYDIAVEYDVITGIWAWNHARDQTRKDLGTAWASLQPAHREAAIHQRIGPWQAKCDQIWQEICQLGGISRDELKHRLDAIIAEVQSAAITTWECQRIKEQKEFGISDEEFKAKPILEQRQAHVVLPRVSDEIAFAFGSLAEKLPDMIEVQRSRRREYPWLSAEVPLSRTSLPKQIRSDEPVTIRVTGVADHILGGMRDETWATDVARRPRRSPTTGELDLGWYRPGDSVGSRGVERVFEDHLRGFRGVVHKRMDSGQQSRTEAIPGKDLHLTIDIALQARVQAVLSHEFGLTRVQPWQGNVSLPLGTPLNSAAVVIEVETGEILAMVSMPTVAMGETMTDEQRRIEQSIVNRPVEAVYPPGSIIKPLVLAAAVSENLHHLSNPIQCTGSYFENQKEAARCWIYRERYGMRTHEALLADEALARSCNIFFYTLADRLGMERQVKWLGAFGLGSVLDIGLLCDERDARGYAIGEGAGEVPSPESIADMKRKGQLKFTEVIMGIGQGPIAWTPVQAANAYATLARGGVIRDATLVVEHAQRRPKRTDDLKLSKMLVATALDGLRQAVMESYGTGHHISYDDGTQEPIINARGVIVWAKTGTAQANLARKLDHSWFVGLVGPSDSAQPMHAIAVIVENGGSGGKTAGPIANQIIRALQAEGYLPGEPDAPVSTSGRTSDEPQDDGGDD